MTDQVPSNEYLEEVRKRLEAATPGPWKAFIEGRDYLGGDSFIQRGPLNSEEDFDLYLLGATTADYEFIAHARQDIPILLDAIEHLKQLLENCK
jgi:hypothetical protein